MNVEPLGVDAYNRPQPAEPPFPHREVELARFLRGVPAHLRPIFARAFRAAWDRQEADWRRHLQAAETRADRAWEESVQARAQYGALVGRVELLEEKLAAARRRAGDSEAG